METVPVEFIEEMVLTTQAEGVVFNRMALLSNPFGSTAVNFLSKCDFQISIGVSRRFYIREYEYLSITRDTTEADIKQRRKIRSGSPLYTDLVDGKTNRSAAAPRLEWLPPETEMATVCLCKLTTQVHGVVFNRMTLLSDPIESTAVNFQTKCHNTVIIWQNGQTKSISQTFFSGSTVSAMILELQL
ncbi:hypothetical protein L596_019803 [Steinernema carpocapsae]|uniref:Uncharacterized protein n=1 Tax=Steinernema carpocapsae TaxID=34508 RepID=A0A4V6A0V8_STECR|nr:hypothetical protein L596_019803 [Steinernema carpocapsae]